MSVFSNRKISTRTSQNVEYVLKNGPGAIQLFRKVDDSYTHLLQIDRYQPEKYKYPVDYMILTSTPMKKYRMDNILYCNEEDLQIFIDMSLKLLNYETLEDQTKNLLIMKEIVSRKLYEIRQNLKI